MTAERNGQRIELALASPSPASALHELATALKAEGMSQVAMYRLFAEFRKKISVDDPRLDPILETMDLIWGGGWARGRAIYPTELTDAGILESQHEHRG